MQRTEMVMVMEIAVLVKHYPDKAIENIYVYKKKKKPNVSSKVRT